MADDNENTAAIYPPKYQAEAPVASSSLLRSITSLFIYLGLGYVLTRRIDILVVIIVIIIFHELGHFLAMKYYRYADVSIFFIPLLGALVSGSKREVSQRQNAVILLAGPLPGILLGLALYFIDKNAGGIHWGNISLNFISLLFIWLNIINLLPVYPLDGGQLLNRVFLDEEGFASNIFLTISAVAVVWLSVHTKFYILLIIPAMLIFRFLSSRKYLNLEKKLLEAGINLDQAYEELSDEDYWKIRKMIVQHNPTFSKVNPGPPYFYDSEEERLRQEVEDALQRNLLIDITIREKIIVFLIWAFAVASPWLLNIEGIFTEFFRRFI